ncbi:MAG: hypothetical protein U5J96_07565 [Ignavibacteriaceae bacterium]|nr:hypothetical protein [Ignavibacteriaceae bacterium]
MSTHSDLSNPYTSAICDAGNFSQYPIQLLIVSVLKYAPEYPNSVPGTAVGNNAR